MYGLCQRHLNVLILKYHPGLGHNHAMIMAFPSIHSQDNRYKQTICVISLSISGFSGLKHHHAMIEAFPSIHSKDNSGKNHLYHTWV